MTRHGHRHAAPTTAGRIIRWAPFYDLFGWVVSFGRLPAMREETIRIAALQPGESLLDVGCGTGTLTRMAAAQLGPTSKVAGIDASPEMIETARKKAARSAPQIDFRLAAIEQMPFAGGEFDVVVSSLMLHHLPDDLKERGLAEVRRVLAPGGRLVVVDLLSFPGPLGHFMGHNFPADYSSQLSRMIAAAGFGRVETVGTGHKNVVFIRAVAEEPQA